jgi:hypothetical protein
MVTPADRFRLPAVAKDQSSVPTESADDHKGQWVLRRVASNGVVSVDNQMFSVGNAYKGVLVDAFVDDTTIQVWSQNHPVKTVARVRKGPVRKVRADGLHRPRSAEAEMSRSVDIRQPALGDMAGTLRNAGSGIEANRLVRLQFELVEFSSLKPWLPDSSFQRDALTALYEFAQQELGIPKTHVWPDTLEPGTVWAVENNPRRPKKFPGTAGWYSHGEVPENTLWDMGSCFISKLMDQTDEPDMARPTRSSRLTAPSAVDLSWTRSHRSFLRRGR